MMLDTTRSGTFVAGSNRLPAASGAAWLALLPSLEPRRVLVLGVPSRPVLIALAHASGSLTVRCRTERRARRARAILAGAPVRVEVGGGSIPEAGFELVVVSRSEDRQLETVLPMLAPEGVAVVEESGARLRDPGLVNAERIILRPAFGEVTAAAPERSPNARRALERRGLWSGGVVARAFGRSREVGGVWLRALPERRIVVGASGPPAYLSRVAAQAGIDVGGYDWAMSAPGRYRSNKIVFFLFEPGADAPKLVVKLTRDPELNDRLEVEREALGHLRAAGMVPRSTIPEVAFSGAEAGRALLGLTAIEGKPFTAVTQASAGCPHVARAFSWLGDLGASTAIAGSGAELAAHLGEILERFLGLYDVGVGYRTMLEEQIRIIERSSAPFPVIFQHGDPGAWNLLVAEDGAVAFLDWEAAEPRGVPLWDVFHLARSFAVVAGRRGGEGNALRAIERILLSPGAINEMVADVIGGYRDRVRVPAELVEPLFHTSWMHRALKEATRLPKGRLDEGRYLALLRRGIDLRDTPGVKRLLGGEEV